MAYYTRLLLFPDAPAGTPPPLEVPEGGDMVASMVASMESQSGGAPAAPAEAAPAAPPAAAPAPGAKPPEPAKAPAPAAKSTPPAPAAKPNAQPPKPAAPAPKPGAPAAPAEKPLDWKSAPEQFRAAHEKLVQVHQQETTRLSTELQQTSAKMRELEGRKFLTPDQEQKYANLEKEQQRLAAELYARDYELSPEFKEKYENKAIAVFKDMDVELKGMMVNGEDGNQRQATRADFNKVVTAAYTSKSLAIKTAKELFNEDDAQVVIDGARQLANIQREGQAAIEAKRTGYQSEREQQQQRFQQESEQARQSFTQYDGMLAQKFPQYFAPIEGNEAYNKALEEGLKYVDETTQALNNLTPAARVQQTALLRRFAAVFPASQVIIKQKNEEIAALQAQIAQLRGTDPGELGQGGGGGGGEQTEAGGTDGLANEIENMMKNG